MARSPRAEKEDRRTAGYREEKQRESPGGPSSSGSAMRGSSSAADRTKSRYTQRTSSTHSRLLSSSFSSLLEGGTTKEEERSLQKGYTTRQREERRTSRRRSRSPLASPGGYHDDDGNDTRRLRDGGGERGSQGWERRGERDDDDEEQKRRRKARRHRHSSSRSRSESYGKRWHSRWQRRPPHTRDDEEEEERKREDGFSARSPYGGRDEDERRKWRRANEREDRKGGREDEEEDSSPSKHRYRVDSEDRRRDRERRERTRKLEEVVQLASTVSIQTTTLPEGSDPTSAPSSASPFLSSPPGIPPWASAPMSSGYAPPMMWGNAAPPPGAPPPPFPYSNMPIPYGDPPSGLPNYYSPPPPFYNGYSPPPPGYFSSPSPISMPSFSGASSIPPVSLSTPEGKETDEERARRAAEAQKRRERILQLHSMGIQAKGGQFMKDAAGEDLEKSSGSHPSRTSGNREGRHLPHDHSLTEEAQKTTSVEEEDPTQLIRLPSSSDGHHEDLTNAATPTATDMAADGTTDPKEAAEPVETPEVELQRLLHEEWKYLQSIGELPPAVGMSSATSAPPPRPSSSPPPPPPPPPVATPPPRNLPPPEEFIPVIPSSLLEGQFKSFFNSSTSTTAMNRDTGNGRRDGGHSQTSGTESGSSGTASSLPTGLDVGATSSAFMASPRGEHGKQDDGGKGEEKTREEGLASSSGTTATGGGASGYSGPLITLQAPKIAPEAERLAREARRAHVSNFPLDATQQQLVDFFRNLLPQIRREMTLREMKELADLLEVPPEDRLTLPPHAQTNHIDIIRDLAINTAKSKRFAFIEVNLGDIITELVNLSTAATTTGTPHPLLQYIDPKTRKAYSICIRRPRDYGVLDGVDETKVVMTGFPPTMPEDKLKEAFSQFGNVENFDVKEGFAYGEFSTRALALQCRENLHGVILANRMLVVFPLHDWLKIECQHVGIDVTIEDGDPISGKAVMERVAEEAKQDRLKKKVADTQGVLALVQEPSHTPKELMKSLLSMTMNMHDVLLHFSAFYPHLRPLYGSTQLTIYPTRVVALLNMFDDKEVEMDETYSALREEIEKEIEQYGRVDRLVIPRRVPPPRLPRPPSRDTFSSDAEYNEAMAAHEERKKAFQLEMDRYCEEQLHPVLGGYGNVYVVYHTLEEAQWAQQMLVGKQFSGRTVITSFLFEDWILTPEEIALANAQGTVSATSGTENRATNDLDPPVPSADGNSKEKPNEEDELVVDLD